MLAMMAGALFSLPPRTLVAAQNQSEERSDCSRVAIRTIKYRIARKDRTKDGGLFLHISVSKKDFEPSTLLALACRLDSDWHNEPNVFVSIFDSYKSAKGYIYPWAPEKPPHWNRYEASLRASYLRDPAKHEHWIAWYADPLNKEGKTVVTLEQ